MHIFRLIRILKRFLCYWLPIFVVLVVFMSSISVLLGASNETNTIFNIENDNQTSNKSNDDIKDTIKKNTLHDFHKKVSVVLSITFTLLILMLAIFGYIHLFRPRLFGRCPRVMDALNRVMNVQPLAVPHANGRVVIPANDVQQQQNRVINVQPLPVQYANGRVIIPANNVQQQQNRVINVQPLPVQYANGRVIIPANDVPPQQPPEN
ncbi:uncharacterized protein LOC114938318 [Nylanderia fulva]|uniref:uncharacterized protein LOC114938318 n=1 Tax=Nylanderia fulva TaxID=613905 RepID=UPI0010FAD571|nr:uncharacterized protein LOC114938318 [Nylanderia fulva]